MRLVHFLPPAFATAIASVLIAGQRVSLSSLEDEIVVLRKLIHDARESPEFAGSAPTPPRLNRPTSDREPIDWKEIAAQFSEMNNGGMKDMRRMMSFQRRLQAMEADELIQALEEIGSLELGDQERMMLEMRLLGPLVNKDPELALMKFSERIDEEGSGMSWQLSNALGEWAKKDLPAATAWFDKERAEGTFNSKSLDGKSQSRIRFESALISTMLATDFGKASERIASISRDQRKDVLSSFGFNNLKNDDDAAYARLVRSQLQPEEQTEVLSERAANLARMGGFEKVDGFMDRIAVTPEEREASVSEAAKAFIQGKSWQSRITTDQIDEMREWVGKQSPDSVGQLTGSAIATALNNGQGTKFSDAREMVLKYHDETGGDDVLIGFLSERNSRQNKEEARKLAGKISDPVKRDEILENLK